MFLDQQDNYVAASAFRKLSSIYVFSYFSFGFEGRIWDLIVSVPDHCLSFYFDSIDLLSVARHFNCQLGSSIQTVKVCVKRSKV